MVPSWGESIEFDTLIIFPLVLKFQNFQKPWKIHVKIQDPGGPWAPPPHSTTLKWGAVWSYEDGTNGNFGQNFETQVHATSCKKHPFIQTLRAFRRAQERSL